MPEQDAMNVLEVYRHFGVKAGGSLTSNNLLAVGSDHRWNSKDLQSGVELAIRRGWIVKTPTGWLELTSAGAARL